MNTFRYYFFALLHVVILAAWYSSPFWLDWRLVIVTILAYYIQIFVWKECIITTGQFGKKGESFYYHYLTKLGFKVNRRNMSFVLNVVIPITMVSLAILLQVVLPWISG